MFSTAWGRQVNRVAAIAAVAVLAVIGNYLGAKYYTQWDWTGGGLYTLSDRSHEILAALERPVRFVSFLVPEESASPDAVEQIHVLLDAYRAARPELVTVETIDPRRDPARARALLSEFDLDPMSDSIDIVMVESEGRRKQVRLEEMVEFDTGGFGGPAAVRSLTAESALTAALLAVTRERQPVVRYATGHGEREMRGGAEQAVGHLIAAIERSDARVLEWEAVGATEVPDGTDVVIVAGPTRPWLAPEREALARFLEEGGAALLLLDPVLERSGAGALAETGLAPLLERWGLGLHPDIVIDPARALPFFGAGTFHAAIEGGHAVAGSLAGQPVLMTLARSLAVADAPPAGVTITRLVTTSPEAWGERDLDALDRAVERGEDEPAGPLVIAAAAERSASGAEEADADGSAGAPEGGDAGGGGRLVVVGDSDFAANASLDQLANRGFALNAVAWLAEGNESLGIPPRERTLSQLFLTSDQLYLELLPLVLILFPLLAIGAGLSLWWRRRQA